MHDIDTTMAWPGFRQAAARMGLHASLSVPLFAGSGATIAVLNLYGHDPVTLVPLSARVWAVFDADPATSPKPDVPLVDGAGEDLITGLVEAFEVRALIQRAIGVVMATKRCTAQDAYLSLRVRAAEMGAGLTDVAARVQQLPRTGGDPRP